MGKHSAALACEALWRGYYCTVTGPHRTHVNGAGDMWRTTGG